MDIQRLSTAQASQEAALSPSGKRKGATADPSANRRQDPVELSSQALDSGRQQADAVAASRATALPEVREERVADATARVQDGYYDAPEVQDKLADKLAQSMIQGKSS